MNFKKIKSAAGRVGASVGIISALGGLGGDPIARNTSGGLSKQYADYGKQVVLPSTEKDIARILRKATTEKSARDKNGYSLTAKDIKRLK
ncbi:hypothetical protein PXH69_34390 [Rhodococcus qingshengii]|uniref:Uncharacterized protein n=1 Tax=Rhodococcus qingshengii TaxID=334542 RepID=A0AAW6LXG2_RHOSG|nr:hypothetical protein [Rhodococcus qingshengii]MDE8650050.1 hypothetical protein [Rhodococcus qingshengii]